METLHRGANLLIDRSFLEEDGTTTLVRDAVSALKLEISQNGTILATYIHDTDDELRDSPTADHYRLELTPTFTATCAPGELVFKWYISATDDDFDESSDTYTDVFEETLITIQ